MGAASFQVRLTASAVRDLEELDDYWIARLEPERGEQYVRDLIQVASSRLANPSEAWSGSQVRVALLPETREIRVFKSSYRIIYRIDEPGGIVQVLRFWHSHRDEREIEDLE
jgi:plasmid stabilization system protein ParE